MSNTSSPCLTTCQNPSLVSTTAKPECFLRASSPSSSKVAPALLDTKNSHVLRIPTRRDPPRRSNLMRQKPSSTRILRMLKLPPSLRANPTLMTIRQRGTNGRIQLSISSFNPSSTQVERLNELKCRRRSFTKQLTTMPNTCSRFSAIKSML